MKRSAPATYGSAADPYECRLWRVLCRYDRSSGDAPHMAVNAGGATGVITPLGVPSNRSLLPQLTCWIWFRTTFHCKLLRMLVRCCPAVSGDTRSMMHEEGS
jgi:hypothetical protein